MATPTTFPSLKGPRVFERVVEHVRSAILSGTLKPGDRLPPERVLVRQFEVGRGVIREALRILEQSGLVRIRPGNGGGTFVREQTTEAAARSLADLLRFGNVRLADITEVRLGLEALIVDAVLAPGRRHAVQHLATNVERASRAFDEGRTAERVEENFNFHVLLAEATGNPLYPLLVRCIVDATAPLVRTGGSAALTRRTLASHLSIARHLAGGDAAAAKRELSRHTLDVHRLIARATAQAERAARSRTRPVAK